MGWSRKAVAVFTELNKHTWFIFLQQQQQQKNNS